jgi:hypothetical protein
MMGENQEQWNKVFKPQTPCWLWQPSCTGWEALPPCGHWPAGAAGWPALGVGGRRLLSVIMLNGHLWLLADWVYSLLGRNTPFPGSSSWPMWIPNEILKLPFFHSNAQKSHTSPGELMALIHTSGKRLIWIQRQTQQIFYINLKL